MTQPSETCDGPHKTPFPMPDNLIDSNIVRRPWNSAATVSRYTQDDAQSIGSTVQTENSNITDIMTTTSSSISERQEQRRFMDRCLMIHTLHERCGDIYVIGLHELPCQFPHLGIVRQGSDLALASSCADMAQYFKIRKLAACEDCTHTTKMEIKKDWLGREKAVKSVVKARNGQKLSMKIVSERRNEFLRKTEQQGRRKEAARMV